MRIMLLVCSVSACSFRFIVHYFSLCGRSSPVEVKINKINKIPPCPTRVVLEVHDNFVESVFVGEKMFVGTRMGVDACASVSV